MAPPSPATPHAPPPCRTCGTELAPGALSCPSCGTLVHAAELKALAADAEARTASGALGDARVSWQQALDLLPQDSAQYVAIKARLAELSKRIASTPAAQAGEPADTRPWWKRGAAAAITLVLLALSKLKFLLLGFGKLTTLLSMLAFAGVYWTAFGWKLAVGFALSIYIHEMGHVAELKRQGIPASAPLFIPGLGALVLLRQHVDDPRVDARIGLAGPVWGLGAGLAAYGIYASTGDAYWGALAHLTGYINLFNLLPVWQLDGSRGFHALSRRQRWVIVAAIAIAFLVTDQRLLLIIGAVAIYRALQPAIPEGDRSALGTFVILIGALSWMASLKVAMP